MTPAELLSIPPQQILAMTDEQLRDLLAPLIPAARQPFIQQRAADTIVTPSGRTITKKQQERDNQMMAEMLRKMGMIQ